MGILRCSILDKLRGTPPPRKIGDRQRTKEPQVNDKPQQHWFNRQAVSKRSVLCSTTTGAPGHYSRSGCQEDILNTYSVRSLYEYDILLIVYIWYT